MMIKIGITRDIMKMIELTEDMVIRIIELVEDQDLLVTKEEAHLQTVSIDQHNIEEMIGETEEVGAAVQDTQERIENQEEKEMMIHIETKKMKR